MEIAANPEIWHRQRCNWISRRWSNCRHPSIHSSIRSLFARSLHAAHFHWIGSTFYSIIIRTVHMKADFNGDLLANGMCDVQTIKWMTIQRTFCQWITLVAGKMVHTYARWSASRVALSQKVYCIQRRRRRRKKCAAKGRESERKIKKFYLRAFVKSVPMPSAFARFINNSAERVFVFRCTHNIRQINF